MILPTHTPTLFDSAVQQAASVLRGGDPVALPTETVYGLAANALDVEAVNRIFEVKGRPAHNPIIVHVAGIEMAQRCVRIWPAKADRLARAFWPGPLTLVMDRSDAIPNPVTAGGDTVGIRWPSHPLIQAVIRACSFPLAAPSANLSTQVSPTTASHVQKALGGRIPLIIDGGPSPIGIESTVIDLSVDPPRVLRPGMIHAESLISVVGELDAGLGDSGQELRSPGLLPKHYAPRARLKVIAWQREDELERQLPALEAEPARTHIIAHTCIPSDEHLGRVCIIPHDAEAFARALYAELHRCDEAGAELIVIEALPARPEWTAVTDRLKRAQS